VCLSCVCTRLIVRQLKTVTAELQGSAKHPFLDPGIHFTEEDPPVQVPLGPQKERTAVTEQLEEVVRHQDAFL